MSTQAFHVRTGICLADPGAALATWRVLVRAGCVPVSSAPVRSAPEPK